jgi:prevent-host-death family protein
MKIIPLREAKAKLSEYAQRCRQEPVVVTVNGRPRFELVPLDDDDDLVGQLMEHNPDFRRLLEERLRKPGRALSVDDALRRL